MSLKFISLKEEEGRCGNNVYSLNVKNDGIERKYLMDTNHQANLANGRFIFKRNTYIDRDNYRIRRKWNYNEFPFESCVLYVLGNGDCLKDMIIDEINAQYRKQEVRWKKQDLKKRKD